MSSLIKEMNRLISKGICFFIWYFISGILKTSILSERKFEEMWQGLFGETFILVLSSSAVFRLQNRVSDFF